MQTISFIGCGKVGKTLARLLHEKKCYKIQQILTRNINSAITASSFINSGKACSSFKQLQPADIWVLAVNDDNLTICADKLLTANVVKAGNIVIHLSGLKTANEVLAKFKTLNAHIGSFHPIKAFAKASIAIKNFQNTFIAFDGDEKCFNSLAPSVEKIGGKVFKIKTNNKSLYHSALVFASNYLVTLSYSAKQLLTACNIEPAIQKELLQSLMSKTLANLMELPEKDALTGPIKRNDTQSLQEHILALKEFDENLAEIYEKLMQRTKQMLVEY